MAEESQATADSLDGEKISWEHLTDSSKEVMRQAFGYRVRFDTDRVYSEFLAMGLLLHENGELPQLLSTLQLSPDSLQAELDSIGRAGDPPRTYSFSAWASAPPSEGEFEALAVDVERLLDRARVIAFENGADGGLVRPRDLFGAVLSSRGTVAYKALAAVVSLHFELAELEEPYLEFLAEKGERQFSDWLIPFLGRAARGQADLPVGLNEDKLGMAKYAHALALLAVASPPPFTIGVYGPWGSGKSSLLKMIQERLEWDFPPGGLKLRQLLRPFLELLSIVVISFVGASLIVLASGDHLIPSAWWTGAAVIDGYVLLVLLTLLGFSILSLRRGGGDEAQLLVIPFNAWEQKDSRTLWARLVERIYEEMEKKLQLRPTYYVRFILQHRLRQLPVLLRARAIPLGSAAAFAVLPWLVPLLLQRDASETATAGLVGGATSLPMALYGLWKPATQMVRELVRSEGSSESGLIADIRDDLRFLYKAITRQDLSRVEFEQSGFTFGPAGPPKFRIVVLIDDLDRCPPDKAVDILEAIKLTLDQPFFIVFLAVDTRMLVQAIEERYAGKLPETVHPGGPGMEYLEKVVQLPFWLPQPRMEAYVQALLAKDTEREKASPPEDTRDEARPSILGAGLQEMARLFPLFLLRRLRVRPLRREATTDELSNVPLDNPPRIAPTADEAEKITRYWNFFSASPRGVKRVVNLFRLAKSLTRAFEVGSPARDPETEKLIKLIILGERWPEFWRFCYEHVVNRDAANRLEFPALLKVFRRREARESRRLPPHISSARRAELELLRHLLDDEPRLSLEDARELMEIVVNLPRVRSWDSLAESQPTSA